MKRFLSVLVCLLLIASLCACSEDKPAPSTDTDTTKTTMLPSTPENTDTNSPLFGDYYGNSYSNTLLNIGISFPNDWTLLSTEAIAESN